MPISYGEKMTMRKTLRALPKIKSKVGAFYYVEKEAKLTLLDNITRGIAFMMISFK
jgi:hypothetical protein